jgi:putative transposase
MPIKRIEEAANGRGSTSERKARAIHSLREAYRLKDILEAVDFPKSTYMYWQKRFDREDPDQTLLASIQQIRKENTNYGYRRIWGALRNQGLVINKKRVQRVIQKYGLQVKTYRKKSRRYNSYKGNIGKVAPNRVHRRFRTSVPHQKITTDTTEFKYYPVTKNGNVEIRKLYLDPFLDM